MENSLPGWTRSWQGVRQFWPNEVFASAPGGSDSIASVSACGADFMKSRLRLGIVAEHAASMRPHDVTAMTRLMEPRSGHAVAPPSATSNSRRPMVTVIRPSRARCVREGYHATSVLSLTARHRGRMKRLDFKRLIFGRAVGTHKRGHWPNVSSRGEPDTPRWPE